MGHLSLREIQAGAELSWMANRYPDRVAGVVYLEAAIPTHSMTARELQLWT